jgi:hypothetical protein
MPEGHSSTSAGSSNRRVIDHPEIITPGHTIQLFPSTCEPLSGPSLLPAVQSSRVPPCWEIDLWGGIARDNQAARAVVQAYRALGGGWK